MARLFAKAVKSGNLISKKYSLFLVEESVITLESNFC